MSASAGAKRRQVTLAAVLVLLMAVPVSASAVPIRSFILDYNRPRLYFSAEVVPVNGPACSGGAQAFMTVWQLRPRRVLRDRVEVHKGSAGCARYDDGSWEGSLFVGRLKASKRYQACLRTFQFFYDRQGRERLSDHTRCRVFRGA